MASAIKSIFVIEDNEDIGFILDYFLREEGFKVRLFASAEDFTNAFKYEVPDIFLVDVMLPDGDGISLCNLIKDDSRFAEVPVLICRLTLMKSAVENVMRRNSFPNHLTSWN